MVDVMSVKVKTRVKRQGLGLARERFLVIFHLNAGKGESL